MSDIPDIPTDIISATGGTMTGNLVLSQPVTLDKTAAYGENKVLTINGSLDLLKVNITPNEVHVGISACDLKLNGSDTTPKYSSDGVNYYNLVLATQLPTLFGNKSLTAGGNIDLYKHTVSFTKSDRVFYTDIYSSKSSKIASIEDLKSYLGDTYKKDLYGVNAIAGAASAGLYVDNTSVYFLSDNQISYDAITGYTIDDTITTI